VSNFDNRVQAEPAAQQRADCVQCANSMLVQALVEKLHGRGLDSRLITYKGGEHEGDHVEEIVVVNPAARERGEVRIGDDGHVIWEYDGRIDEAGISKILDDATNALRASGVLLRRIRL
jgi:hypothetical protein